ncbi:hypothetical protein CK203_062667 [Vitis vinifera]|uniref:Uncharacterized protein n=1 Tax=Vitis vinifera TaxID=29760 RepID=A0A438FRW7_VITVI|nr:hypothetical protein CK203_062667 [Vitis vinifera]
MIYTQSSSEAAPKEQSEFNKDETEKLRNLLGILEKPISTGACSHALSRAIDHITYSSYKFNTYSPCPRSRKIGIADGTLTTMAGQGDKNKLDWETKRMIGHVKEKDGLYHLEEPCSQSGIKNKLP